MADTSFESLANLESGSDLEDEVAPAVKRHRGAGRSWIKVREFDSAAAAKDFIASEVNIASVLK